MSGTLLLGEISKPVSVPRLLVDQPSRTGVFFDNLRDFIFPQPLPDLELDSQPAPFWPDVFVHRHLPWSRFLQSAAYHVIALAFLIAFTRFFALQPRVIARPAFDRPQVIYYEPSEYLPPLDTRSETAAAPAKADPEFSPQPIISVPPEADNRSQTIVTPPNVKLNHDVALPNIVAWSEKMEKPRLAVPPIPLTPAADISRIARPLENAVAAPPSDAAHLSNGRSAPVQQNSVVAPPPDLRASNAVAFQSPQPAVIAPPPDVEISSARPMGELNIAPSSVIAPAPQLPLAAQRVAPGSASAGLGAPQVVAPPPSLSASGSPAEFGARGRIVALNVHSVVGSPPDPTAGNRRGAFASTPEGHPGASGAPGMANGNAASAASGVKQEVSSVANQKAKNDLPSGLYVGNTPATTSPVAGNQTSANSVNPNLMASVRPPSVTGPRTMQPENSTKLTEPERAVFGNRRFYSVTLNMPNLNSAGGSWIIRFAELNHDSANRDSASPADLSQPAATRKVDPAYPLQLMHENVSGTVILYAIIRADGTVSNVRVLRGVDDRLDRFASQAVAQWQFQPAMKNGSPVDVEATFQIPFRPARTSF